MRPPSRRPLVLLTVLVSLGCWSATLAAQAAPKITSSQALIGFTIGGDYMMAG